MSPADLQAASSDLSQRVERDGRKVIGHKLTDGDGRVMGGKIGAATIIDAPYAETRVAPSWRDTPNSQVL